MDHFLTRIIQGTIEQSAESVHRRFVKFSKGEFPNGGPVIKVKATKKGNLAINGSFEYEDLIGYYVAKQTPMDSCKVGGNLCTQPRVALESIQTTLNSLSLSDGWEKGKRHLKNLFIRHIDASLSPEELVQIYEKLSEDCYMLLTISPPKGKVWEFKVADKIPKLKSTFGKTDPYESCKPDTRIKCKMADLCKKVGICIKERIKFCRTKTSALSTEQLANFLQLFLPDFPNIQTTFTDLLLINKYLITTLKLPEDKDSLTPKELREKIKRVGVIERIVYIDDEFHSNTVEFTV